jgi:phage/plasmid-like protein (TIGR03299 family)
MTYDITESTVLLDGFARNGSHANVASGPTVHFPEAVPMEAARQLIDWEPIESTGVTARVQTPEGRKWVSTNTRKLIVHPRTLEVLGDVGSGYAVHPYGRTLLANAALITDGELDIARVGILDGGAKAFVQYEFPESMQAGSKGAHPVDFRAFVNSTTAVDGSMATAYFTGSIVTVCKNTLAMAIRDAKARETLVKVRHTRNSLLNVQEAREVLGVVFQVSKEFEAEVNKLTAEYVSDDTWNKFLDAYVPVSDASGRGRTVALAKRDEFETLWNNDERVAPWKNSAYGVLAVANTWAQHYASVRKVTREERTYSRLINGQIEKNDQKALQALAAVR